MLPDMLYRLRRERKEKPTTPFNITHYSSICRHLIPATPWGYLARTVLRLACMPFGCRPESVCLSCTVDHGNEIPCVIVVTDPANPSRFRAKNPEIGIQNPNFWVFGRRATSARSRRAALSPSRTSPSEVLHDCRCAKHYCLGRSQSQYSSKRSSIPLLWLWSNSPLRCSCWLWLSTDYFIAGVAV
jgi:hypothetical protein